jgi:clan AA aspartic protease
MIAGIVTPSLEAVVRTYIEDVRGQSQAIDVVIDTGFSGFMSLPISTVNGLGLPVVSQENTQLADGTIKRVDIHAAVVIWDGKARRIEVQTLGIHQLIGMAMLASHDLAIRVQDGGSVSISFVP